MQTAMARDYYDVLGVSKDADSKTLKEAFRTQARRYHPDRNKAKDAEEHFKEVAEAYAVLSDPQKRAAYDRHGPAGIAGFSRDDLFGGLDLGDIFGGLDFGGGLFDRVFGESRHHGFRRDLRVDVAVDLERILSGGEEQVTFQSPTSCQACGGSGGKHGAQPERCDTCNGTGQRVSGGKGEGGVTVQYVSSCPTCTGRGQLVRDPCPTCHGNGTTVTEETLTVRIPPGLADGATLRVAGRGLPGGAKGEAPGDLLVTVHARPDPRFERRGSHLWRRESISVADAVLGATVSVPTLNRDVKIKVPPGTQPGAVIRVRGRGLPRYGRHERGDLYVQVNVHIPDEPSRKTRELYGQLRKTETEESRRG